MLDIEFVKKQLGLENEDPKTLMPFLKAFEKFNDVEKVFAEGTAILEKDEDDEDWEDDDDWEDW